MVARTSIKRFANSLVIDNLESDPASNVGPLMRLLALFQIPGSFSADRAPCCDEQGRCQRPEFPFEIVEAAEIDG